MHVDEGLLQALLDGEVDQTAAAEARRHIDECTQCRGLLAELRGDDQWLEGIFPGNLTQIAQAADACAYSM